MIRPQAAAFAIRAIMKRRDGLRRRRNRDELAHPPGPLRSLARNRQPVPAGRTLDDRRRRGGADLRNGRRAGLRTPPASHPGRRRHADRYRRRVRARHEQYVQHAAACGGGGFEGVGDRSRKNDDHGEGDCQKKGGTGRDPAPHPGFQACDQRPFRCDRRTGHECRRPLSNSQYCRQDRNRTFEAARDGRSNHDSRRKVYLKDGGKTSIRIESPPLGGKDRLKESFGIPGYPDARAKLTIRRTSEALEREQHRFRRGGILVKSRHAVHEATLFDKDLETDPHALRFFGRLVCDYIDHLWNDFDKRVEERAGDDPRNPTPILDPSRRSGLTREHPFVKALFAEVLKRLRPLIEEERQRAEKERATIESRATRKRLDALERAATRFMERFGTEQDSSRDPEGASGRLFQERGYNLSPPFAQIVQGHSIRCCLRIKQSVFPEIESGAAVQVDCLTDEVAVNKRFVPIQPHAVEEDVLQATWKLTGVRPTPATGMVVRIGPVLVECMVEVLESEADRYSDIDALQFQKQRYRLKLGGNRKRVQILAPIARISGPGRVEVSVDNSRFSLSGDPMLHPREKLGVAMCDLRIGVTGTEETSGFITARIENEEATAEVFAVQPLGAGIKINLEDIRFGNQRYRWRQNVLEIAARHPALQRYLGPPPEFEGQDAKHFRVVLAEVIADAVCARLISDNVRANPGEYEDADWDHFYAEYSRLITNFLPDAHKLQVPSEG